MLRQHQQEQDDSLVSMNTVVPDYTYKPGKQHALFNREKYLGFCMMDRRRVMDPQVQPPQLDGQSQTRQYSVHRIRIMLFSIARAMSSSCLKDDSRRSI
jgi:hypothetical protein